MTIRTRFAPSPTGFLHIGSLRTALYAYVLAKHSGGDFILRIEDTDQKREVEGALQSLQDVLHKFGLQWDEFYIQSARHQTGIYQQAAEKLVKDGHAFYCQCPARNAQSDGYSTLMRDPCRDLGLTKGAIKLRVPDNETISYHDFAHRKEISWSSNQVYDATLLKSDTFPTYALAAMVDDLDMKVTHILRGHDWLPSTPIHLLVLRYLGGEQPQIGHLTDILSSTTGKKLSKRRDSVFCEQYLEQGYLPEAILNFVALLGWAPKDNRELFTLEEFVSNFDIHGFQKSNPVINIDKLNWFNGHYIRQKSDTELTQLVKPFVKSKLSDTQITQISPLVKERMVTLADFPQLSEFFFSRPSLPPEPPISPDHLRFALDNFDKLVKGELIDDIKSQGWKVGDFFMSLRVAVCGSRSTPPITETMQILGKEESLKRINLALKHLNL